MTWDIKYVVLIVGTLAAAFIISAVLRKAIGIFIIKYSKKIKADPTNFSFLKNSISFIVFTGAIIFIFYSIPSFKSFGKALFAGLGIFAAFIGLALQKTFSNLISGIFILMFKPFRIDDTLKFSDDKMGVVEEITLRHTIIRDYENRRIIIPNSVISEEVIVNSNISDVKIRKHIGFSISYDSNIDKAIEIIQDELKKHPFFIDNRTQKDKKSGVSPVVVRVIALSDFSVDLKAYVWTKGTDNAFVLKCDALKSVKERFDREGIEIPFPYRTVVYKRDTKEDSRDPQISS
ncbi:MAG: mechanosensitive ion channel family protein [Candidatus Marinimicrobia bacterium]|nr:mechanosensitive ion channel family protein [Candidatus Neomarinimicrobiota bacterium]